ncbi:hypothetical protein [Pengzhenrongella frigida]|uniref:Uncharacterized protein n=1 Tax=Pengzhenrongella frigida TaxID=1259133 RepID=A0A4Q5MY97_9MICO|nr:hypothetical protein [Cellulomonas sp. HLT2-17]RYV50619.1 hypothetical protein EUA98_12810 [Cellulomonas sp. HLT2-17]
MTLTATKRQPLAVRRTGYLVSVLVNAVLLYAANVWPGWDAVPFLTSDMTLVIGLVNASIIVNLVANLVYLVRDPRWLRALGDLLTVSVGLAAMAAMWQVFPFDFSGSSFDWTLVARILLGVGIGGSIIGIVVAIVAFVRAVATRSG